MNTSYMKVLCPVERENKPTLWMRLGTAFPNKDGSTNIYLDALPTNNKLQLRELNDKDRERMEARRNSENLPL